MTLGDTVRSGPSTLNDEAFHDLESVEVGLDLMVARALEGAATRLLIDVPKRVEAAAPQGIPVLGAWCRTLAEDRAIDWRRVAALVAVRLDDGAAVSASLFRWKQSAQVPAVFDAPVADGLAADGFAEDLAARAPDLPRDGGTWAITALVADHASNRAFSHVDGPTAPRVATPSPAPGAGRFPSYLPTSVTPAVPRSAGVALDPLRVMVLAPDVRCVLPGSFRLPGALCLPTPEGTAAHDLPCPAVAPITLVATRDDALEPFAVTVLAPCFDAAEGAPEVSGVFSVDLFAFDGFSREPGTVRLWAFAGPLVEGPFPMELVDESALAPL